MGAQILCTNNLQKTCAQIISSEANAVKKLHKRKGYPASKE